uniref:Bm11042 n=1 Tax=Brugia malayi TaxID=6279 RepID=A0A1I9G6T4_BRUMA|nr:Bm11042 [Brugia malayi]
MPSKYHHKQRDGFDAQKIVTYMTNMGVLAFPGGYQVRL